VRFMRLFLSERWVHTTQAARHYTLAPQQGLKIV